MKKIQLDLKGSFITYDEMQSIKPQIMEAQQVLLKGSGVSNDMIGWINYMNSYDEDEYEEIKISAQYINNNSDAIILLGIGGSYLGARASIEAIRGNFHNELCKPQIYYAGQNLSGSYLKKLLEVIKNKEVSVIVVSKSGTTLETALAFRIIRDMMDEKYKEESKNRIFVVTDEKKGALKRLSELYGYKAFKIPDNIGGRYSVITPVGLLPMAA
ncbi:MAG: glucose-6-phosphate isomerase, partial [Sedimentibacter sp.]